MASDVTPVRPRAKICGLQRREDALLAERLGADFLGFVLSDGFGRSIPPDRAAEVVLGTTRPRVAVLVDERPDRAVELASSIEASVIQLHGAETPEVVVELRNSGAWQVWKAVRVRAVEDVVRAVLDYGSVVDGLLIEGSKPGVIGGGGARIEALPEAVREAVPSGLTLILAGGLRPNTVADAIARFRPEVVDVSSGVELVPGRKDVEHMRQFLEAARRG